MIRTIGKTRFKADSIIIKAIGWKQSGPVKTCPTCGHQSTQNEYTVAVQLGIRRYTDNYGWDIEYKDYDVKVDEKDVQKLFDEMMG